MPDSKKTSANYQYPFPLIPKKWGHDEMQFAQGIRRLFDLLFSKKVQSVLLADESVTSRVLAPKAVALKHIADGFGAALDISGNASITELDRAAELVPEIYTNVIFPTNRGLIGKARLGVFVIAAGIAPVPGPSVLAYGKLGNFMLYPKALGGN